MIKYWRAFKETVFYDISLVLLSMSVGLIFGTSMAGIIVDFQAAGIDPVQKPEVETSVEKIDVEYNQGTRVYGYENLRWQSGYELYHIGVRNSGSKPIRNVQIDLQLPGCVIGYRKQSSVDRIGIHSESQAYVVKGNASKEITSCKREISITRLPPGDGAALSIVIKRFGTGFPDNATDGIIFDQKVSTHGTISYDWYYQGHRERERLSVRVEGANQSYIDVFLHFSRTAYHNQRIEKALYYSRKAYDLAPNNTRVLRSYGFTLAEYGYKENKMQLVRKGKDKVLASLKKNSSDPITWYYRAAVETDIAMLSDNPQSVKKHYCLAKASLTQATRDGELIPRAQSLKKKLEQHNPGVNCTITQK